MPLAFGEKEITETKTMYIREIKTMYFGVNKNDVLQRDKKYVLLLMPKMSRVEMMPHVPC